MDKKQVPATLVRVIIIVAIIAYVIMPLDAAPGPIDDIVVALLGLGASAKLSA